MSGRLRLVVMKELSRMTRTDRPGEKEEVDDVVSIQPMGLRSVLEDIDGVEFISTCPSQFQSAPSIIALTVPYYYSHKKQIHQTLSQGPKNLDGYNNWRWCERAAYVLVVIDKKTLLECLDIDMWLGGTSTNKINLLGEPVSVVGIFHRLSSIVLFNPRDPRRTH